MYNRSFYNLAFCRKEKKVFILSTRVLHILRTASFAPTPINQNPHAFCKRKFKWLRTP